MSLKRFAIATSIDALAVGITFAFLKVKIAVAVSFIGVITAGLSAIGVFIGHKFGEKYKSKAEFAGGLILILLGTKITAVAIWAIVIVNIFFPVATIIEIVMGLLGLGEYSAAIVAVIKSCKHYLNVKDYYVEARSYGKKYN